VIATDGRRTAYRVREVVHTVQPSASERPRVRDERATPSAIVQDAPNTPPRALRAGLPRVVVVPEPDAE
jgi:hypothetical protein